VRTTNSTIWLSAVGTDEFANVHFTRKKKMSDMNYTVTSNPDALPMRGILYVGNSDALKVDVFRKELEKAFPGIQLAVLLTGMTTKFEAVY
jgi:hypothetical protein